MKNYYLTITGILGASGVALGALGAHFLKNKMQSGLITTDQLSGFETGTKYQLFHALALLAIYFYNKDKNLKWLNRASVLFITGTLLFSGSLYLLTTRNLTGMEGLLYLGPITPLGGIALIAGWCCLIILAIQSKKTAN
ncbi:MAG: DUF423 domain-containing protein [Bacteroidia bacterium]